VNSIFVVFHEYEMSNGCDHTKLIGVYSSKDIGEELIFGLSQKSGFRDFPDGFSIDEYKIDKIH
jgi:hypothetical protein